MKARHHSFLLLLALVSVLSACARPQPIKLLPVAAAARPVRPARTVQAQQKPAPGTAAPACNPASAETVGATDVDKEKLFRAFTDEEANGTRNMAAEPVASSAPCQPSER